MYIMGIDPSLNKIGWAIIKVEHRRVAAIASGTIKPSTRLELADKLAIITTDVEQLINEYSPQYLAIEKMFVNRNCASSIRFSHARGAILATCARLNMIVDEYFPNTIKSVVSGNGHASKAQVHYMVTQLVRGAQPQNSDEADALAIAYTSLVHKGLA